MKPLILAATVLALSAGVATAAPGHKHRHGGGFVTKHTTVGKFSSVKHFKIRRGRARLTPFEHFKIKRSRARLAALKRRIYFDGRITPRERMRLRIAKRRHDALVRKARWF